MDGHDENRPSASTAVPDLIERFRLRRDAWIAQADELARLRDEVRGSAEREAMEIVTGARHDVRQVVMEARRELLVLSAQVQAALGEVSSKPDPAALLHKVGIDAGEYPAAEAAAQPIDAGFAPEAAIEKILNEVQADMTALADEARTLPGRAVGASETVPALPAAEAAPWDDAGSWAPPGPSEISPVSPAVEHEGGTTRPDAPETVTIRSDGPAPEAFAAAEPPARPAEPETARVADRVESDSTPDLPEADVVDVPLGTGAPPVDAGPDVSTAPAASIQAPASASLVRERLDRLMSTAAPAAASTPAPEAAEPAAAPPPDARSTSARRAIGLSEAASKALLSSPIPSESVPVPSGRSLWTFVALFAAVGLIVVMATTWWLGGEDAPAPEMSADAAAPAREPDIASVAAIEGRVEAREDAPVAVEPSDPPPPPPGGPGNLWVAGEALREVWVRTTVDGRTDTGRTLAPGDTLSVSADRTVALRVGDAGALLVSVNEGAWRPLGIDGEVVTRQFEAEASGTRTTPSAQAPSPAGTAPIAQVSTSALAAPLAGRSMTPATPVAGRPAPPSQPVTSADLRGPTPPPVVASASLPAAGETVTVGADTSTASSQVGDVRAAEGAVLAAAERWLEAYHRQDRATMDRLSAENLLLADERSADERFPPGLSDVQRKLDGVRVQISADMAVLTAVMTERSGASATSRVSPVSQIWVLGEGEWKVRQARFVSEARLNSVLR